LNSLQTLNGLLDAFFVQSLEPAALTAVGAGTTTVFLFMSMSLMMAVASTALVSRSHGARDSDGVQEAARQSLSLALRLGLLAAALCLPAAWAASRVLAPGARAQELTFEYLAIFAAGLPAYFVIQSLAGSLRGIGDTRSPMALSGAQIGLHLLLNVFLIFPAVPLGPISLPGAGWGLKGAAAAMTASAVAAAAAYSLFAARGPLQARMLTKSFSTAWARRLLRIALPSGVMAALRVGSLAAFTAILNQSPRAADSVAALRVGFSIESIAFMPAFGLSVAAAALVGQRLGGQKPDDAARLGWTAAHQAGLVSLAASTVMVIWAGPLAAAVIPSQPGVAEAAAKYLIAVGSTEVFFGYGMVLLGAMQGAGDTVRPLWISVASLWGVRVPLAFVLAIPLGWGYLGCWTAMAVTQVALGALAMAAWRRGAWKTARV
jgi:putative MATE family efflux protein